MICPRCRINLPGRVTHDTAEECLDTLRSRLTMEQSRAQTACRKLDNANARADEWKAKAQACRVGETRGALTTAHRIAALEADREVMVRKVAELEDRLTRNEQRSNFAVAQVDHIQKRGMRRAG
jgi:hypothetical protein